MSEKSLAVVAAVLSNEAGEVLCALRSGTMSHSFLWEFPGGKVQEGESPKEALRRELKEELSCEVKVGSFIKEVTHQYPHIAIRLSAYEATILSGELCAKEHQALLWLPPKALLSLVWSEADIPIVKAVIGQGKV